MPALFDILSLMDFLARLKILELLQSLALLETLALLTIRSFMGLFVSLSVLSLRRNSVDYQLESLVLYFVHSEVQHLYIPVAILCEQLDPPQVNWMLIDRAKIYSIR